MARYCAASEAGDMEALAATLAPDVQMPSPIIGSAVFKGSADVKTVLSAVYGLLGKTTWEPQIGTGDQRISIVHTTVAGLRIDDAMHFELDDQGRISRIRPHLRPLLATVVFTLLIGPRVARHPGVVLRAIRRG